MSELAKSARELLELAEGTFEGPWQAHQTATGEWWISAPDESDHDFRDDYEPIFESSGTGLEFPQTARYIAAAHPEALVPILKRFLEIEDD